MANNSIEMSIIRQVAQLKQSGQSIRSIAETLGVETSKENKKDFRILGF